MVILGLGMLGGGGMYAYFAARLPALPNVEAYQHEAAVLTRVRGWDGTPLGEWASERREIVTLDRIPPRLVQAFVAIEDRRFYEHAGLDYRGIVRAALVNLRAGQVSQGASTITQQVARSFFPPDLFFARTFLRKIPEAILARRMEARYSKNEILTLYLNQIFLGQTSYGVAAAARRYFDKDLPELDLGEVATIAGIARAPSRFEPIGNPDRARARRDQVLAALVAAGFVSETEAGTFRGRPVVTHTPPDLFRERSPYFVEHIRRDIGRRFGDKTLWSGGLEIETTLVPWIDQSAQENVDFSLRKLDKRQGYRGPVARLSGAAADEFRRRADARYGGEPLVEGRHYLGLVESAARGDARVRVGKQIYDMRSDTMTWAVPFSTHDSTNGKQLESTSGVVKKGDVVWVSGTRTSTRRRFADWTYDEKGEVQYLPAVTAKTAPRPAPITLKLDQQPRVQGSIFSYDHDSGYVMALVGGHEYDRSEFNRATQACRQPGSTYKPIYYSLALDRGYGFTSLLNDIPRAEVDPITGEVWVPTNLNNTVEYQVSLEYALIWSKNVPSVQLFKLVGGRDVESWARRLGMTTPIIPDQALALGASCTRLDEMTRAFSAFARNGTTVDPVYIRRLRDRHGQIIEDKSALNDAMGAPGERLDRMVALTAAQPRPPAIPARTAWLTSQLLRHVVTKGHAPALRSTGMPVAGKTGTSSATMDTWFVGYTSKWMTTTWIGDDRRERPLGFKDAAFMLTVPMCARYLWEVTNGGQGLQDVPWVRPPGVKANDQGGSLRTTMEEVKADDEAQKKKSRS